MFENNIILDTISHSQTYFSHFIVIDSGPL